MCTIATINYIDMKVSPIRDIFGASRKRRCKVALKWRWRFLQSGSVDVLNVKQGDIAPKVSTSHMLHYSSLAVAECIALLIQPTCLSYAQSEMDENVGSESHFLIGNANGKTMTTGKRI